MTASRPLVSVIIPTYNYAPFIEQAIRSVERQSYGNLEIIVVDDGSTDGVAALVSGLDVAVPVEVLSQPRRGISAARNAGLGRARGAFISFLDADDYWPRADQLERQWAFLERNPEIGWVFGDAQPFVGQDTIGPPYLVDHGYYAEGAAAAPYRVPITPRMLCTSGFFIPTGTILLRRGCLDRAGPFDESLAMFEDIDLWLRVLRDYPIAFFPEVLLQRRIHPDNSGERRFLHVGALQQLFAKHDLAREGLSLETLSADAWFEAARHHLSRGDIRPARAALFRSLAARFRPRRAIYFVPMLLGSRGVAALRALKTGLAAQRARQPRSVAMAADRRDN